MWRRTRPLLLQQKACHLPKRPSSFKERPGWAKSSFLPGKLIYLSCSIADEVSLERGLPSWSKAQDLRSCLAGVRGFESRTPHYAYRFWPVNSMNFSDMIQDSLHAILQNGNSASIAYGFRDISCSSASASTCMLLSFFVMR